MRRRVAASVYWGTLKGERRLIAKRLAALRRAGKQTTHDVLPLLACAHCGHPVAQARCQWCAQIKAEVPATIQARPNRRPFWLLRGSA